MNTLPCRFRPPSLRNRQSGVALVVGLIFLVVLSLLGISAMQSATLEERMAGNLRDRSLAVQSAEAALRDAENDILGIRANGIPCPAGSPTCRLVGERPIEASEGSQGLDIGKADCAQGQCRFLASTSNPVWKQYMATGCVANSTVAYGTFTGATPIRAVATQPCYLFELFKDDVDGEPRWLFRITARGVGQNPNTVVTVQEVFLKPVN